ncbi:hypothetical protein V6305_19845 [Serratia marcescens]|uniref:hypothetical protein n=1 Tax=Serratia TaxID=613 RepID=UPI00313D3971
MATAIEALSSKESVLKAIEEYKKIGRDEFLKQHKIKRFKKTPFFIMARSTIYEALPLGHTVSSMVIRLRESTPIEERKKPSNFSKASALRSSKRHILLTI